MLEIAQTVTDQDIKMFRSLLAEYAESLEFDLGFQNFEEELANLPGEYARPQGCILLAKYAGQSAGCVALRSLGNGICEMKRLYVRPGFRKRGIGRALAETVIKQARAMGYSRMRLDTVPSMKDARNLYRSLGFEQIDAYRYNPIDSAEFMELKLA